MSRGPLLEVAGLTKHFRLKGGLFGTGAGVVRAVDGITFDVAEGETLASSASRAAASPPRRGFSSTSSRPTAARSGSAVGRLASI